PSRRPHISTLFPYTTLFRSFVYMNANWPDANVGDKETIKIRALDPYHYDLVNWTLETHTNIFKFIFPASYPTPGKTFYQLAHWKDRKSTRLNSSHVKISYAV